jgi:hypothetical protein
MEKGVVAESLDHEINDGLNVVEQWNSANDFHLFCPPWRVLQQSTRETGAEHWYLLISPC